MENVNWRDLVAYFNKLSIKDIDTQTLHQVKRCLIDYLGCSIYAASHNCCPDLTQVIQDMGSGAGKASIWGNSTPVLPALAAFANSARTSNIELDDCSGIGASVHPGVYIWSAALAAWEDTDAPVEDVLRSVVFGYDMCMRMGLLATGKVRELGLHGPGLVGGLGAAVAAGMVYGLSLDQLYNAFSITATLLPVCPFISFIEGADSKDIYGGWGVYLAMFAVAAAKKGLTGPSNVINGEKSLNGIFAGDGGTDVKPGEHFYINDVSFKEFSACHSVHPAMTVILNLKEKHSIDPDQIESVHISTYPYSYELNNGVGEVLNPSSARLSLTYTVAYALIESTLSPEAFTQEKINSGKYQELRRKISVSKHDAFGTGPFGIRGCIIEMHMIDGTSIQGETDSPRWKTAPPDEELIKKYKVLSADALDASEQQNLLDFVMELENQPTLAPIIRTLRGISQTVTN